MKEPCGIRQGSDVALIDIRTGKTTKYVIWDIVVDDKTGGWKLELKTPHPENRVDYVLRIEAEENIGKRKSNKNTGEK